MNCKYFTSWSAVIREKLMALQLLKNSTPEGSLPYSHKPAIGLFPEAYKSNPHAPTLFFKFALQYFPPKYIQIL